MLRANESKRAVFSDLVCGIRIERVDRVQRERIDSEMNNALRHLIAERDMNITDANLQTTKQRDF